MVPYLYIEVIAFCLYIVMFAAFLAAKKTAENKAFIWVLLGFILWSGAAVLMRMRVAPGVAFWFYCSLMALFSIPVLLYNFACAFVASKSKKLKILWAVGTVALLCLTPTGLFLQPPSVHQRAAGEIVFLYDNVDWKLAIPCVLFLAILLSIARLLVLFSKKQAAAVPGLKAIVVGFGAVALGNFLQVIPGNIFPYDMLGGIVFAGCLMYSLVKKKVFRLVLLVSPNVLLVVSMGICFILALQFVPQVEKTVMAVLNIGTGSATAVVVVLFVVCTWLVYAVMQKLIAAIFTKKNKHDGILKSFSLDVSKSLDRGEIQQKLVGVLREAVDVNRVYVLLEKDGAFSYHGETDVYAQVSFSLEKDCACLRYAEQAGPCFSISEFAASPLYEEAEDTEKKLLTALRIQDVVVLQTGEENVGLVLMPKKNDEKPYSGADRDFLNAVAAIAAIAVKNAMLYESIYRQARLDSLTEVYSYSYFVEKLQEDFEENKAGKLALVYLDVDDMKLYNQLYGNKKGDSMLKEIAYIISDVVRGRGTVFRHSGKVFAILLPGHSDEQAGWLAGEIQRRVAELSNRPGEDRNKPLTLSGGICVYPDAARTPQELAENADIAVFNAKNDGKSKITMFRVIPEETKQITERVMQIVDRIERKESSTYSAYSATVLALTAAIDAKDHYTYTHSQNVAYYACMLAVAGGFNDSQVRLVYEAALLHDIGKISIPETILGKTGPLTEDETDVMSRHVESSIEMIRFLPSMDYVIPVVIAHHERWDGGGYPRGIKGDDIPMAARCLAIADSFDAMTSDRPYRKARDLEYSIRELEANVGHQFDPFFCRIFVSLVRRGEVKLR